MLIKALLLYYRKSPLTTFRQNFLACKYTWEHDVKTRSQEPMRRIVAALQCDHAAGNPFLQYLTCSRALVNYFRFWQDVEKCRLDYNFGSMKFSSFSKSVSFINT